MKAKKNQVKQCCYCEKVKPSSKFWLDERAPDGLQPYCAKCGKWRNDLVALVGAVKWCKGCKTFLPKSMFRNPESRKVEDSFCYNCERE